MERKCDEEVRRRSRASSRRDGWTGSWYGGLPDLPRVARAQQPAEVAPSLLVRDRADLVRDERLVARRLDGPQDADRRGEARRRVHPRQQEGVRWVRGPLVV